MLVPSLSVEGCCISTIRAWACRCQVTLHDVSPYIVSHLGIWPGPVVYALVYVLDSVIILLGVSVSHGCCVFVCLWLDHYLHQHSGCGPTRATWLGGVATFTTARDRCTKIVYCSSTTMAGCFTWYFNSRSMLLVIYAFLGMLFTMFTWCWFFMHSLLWFLACGRWCYLIIGLSYAYY